MSGSPTLYEQRAVVPEHVLTRPIDDEVILLSLQSEEYYGLDEVGTRLWELLGSSASVQDAFDAMLAEYDVDAATLAHDIERLVGELAERNLIQLVPAERGE